MSAERQPYAKMTRTEWRRAMTEETPRVAGLVHADVPAAMSVAGLLAESLTFGKSGMPTKAPWTNLPLLP